MQIAIASVAFAAAVLCAGLMGFAIQRGATCTVAAVEEIFVERRCARLLALLEAALWVAGGLVVAAALHVLPAMPSGYAVSAWTIAGGALLGIGASVNGACVFGAVARFGSGEWAYGLTPIGFFLGCLSVGAVFGTTRPHALDAASPLLAGAAWLAPMFLLFALWRVATAWRRARAGRPWHRAALERVWSPHAATTVIGLTFAVMLLLVGGWAYTDVLAELAHGMAASVGARVALAGALLAGAAWGGWTAGRFRHTPFGAAQALRCVAGGVLMGWGSLLVPGGNDGLILLGMPLARPYAWLAFATMAATIALLRWRRRR